MIDLKDHLSKGSPSGSQDGPLANPPLGGSAQGTQISDIKKCVGTRGVRRVRAHRVRQVRPVHLLRVSISEGLTQENS